MSPRYSFSAISTPSAAPSGTAIRKATSTSAAVTPIASCTCGRCSSSPSITRTSLSGGSSSAFTSPKRGSSSHAASTTASSASRARMTNAGLRRRDRLEAGDVDLLHRRERGHADEPRHLQRAVHPFLPELAVGGQLDDVAVELGGGDGIGDLVDL